MRHVRQHQVLTASPLRAAGEGRSRPGRESHLPLLGLPRPLSWTGHPGRGNLAGRDAAQRGGIPGGLLRGTGNPVESLEKGGDVMPPLFVPNCRHDPGDNSCAHPRGPAGVVSWCLPAMGGPGAAGVAPGFAVARPASLVGPACCSACAGAAVLRLRLVVRFPFRAGGPSRSAPGLPRPLGRSESMAEAVLCGGESVGAQGFAGSGGGVRTDRKETKTAWINESWNGFGRGSGPCQRRKSGLWRRRCKESRRSTR